MFFFILKDCINTERLIVGGVLYGVGGIGGCVTGLINIPNIARNILRVFRTDPR